MLWRAVIQLNVVRSIRVILDALERPGSPGVSPVRAGMVHSDSHVRLRFSFDLFRMEFLILLDSHRHIRSDG